MLEQRIRGLATGKGLVAVLLAIMISMGATVSWAIPSPIDHLHDTDTVDWKQPGAAGLPWMKPVADTINHQHLTSDSFDEDGRFTLFGGWDDRIFDFTNRNPDAANYYADPFSHGLIRPDHQVRFFSQASMPDRATVIIADIFEDWEQAAIEKFQANQESWDAIGIGFEKGSATGNEITVSFTPALNAFGLTTSAATRTTIQFLSKPDIFLETNSPDFEIRITDPVTNTELGFGTSVSVPVQWSFDGVYADGSTASKVWDIDYREWTGSAFGAWQETAPAGLPNIRWAAAPPSESIAAPDTINLPGMDFRTIAAHEIGHSLGLDHPADNTGANRTGAGMGPADNLMRWDIGNYAVFNRSQGIDDDSALAAAIDYTFSLNPENFSDYGDAPNSYRTYRASDGPSYSEGNGQHLGREWDYEPDGQPTSKANGDDINYWGVGILDDEDGVVFGKDYVDIMVNIDRAGENWYMLDAWWDLDWSGTFEHIEELIIDELLALDAGEYVFRFNLGFDPRDYFSRFRLTWVDDSNGENDGVSFLTDVTPWGVFVGADGVSHGEVEDYAPVPEPAAILLFGTGLLGFVILARRECFSALSI